MRTCFARNLKQIEINKIADFYSSFYLCKINRGHKKLIKQIFAVKNVLDKQIFVVKSVTNQQKFVAFFVTMHYYLHKY